MHPQLTILLEMQDLRLQRAALTEEPGLDRLETDEFHVELRAALEALDEKIRELQEQLDAPIRARWERGLPHLRRMVVPVIGGVCYGCFMAIPTSRVESANETVQTCENCGRFIYVLP